MTTGVPKSSKVRLGSFGTATTFDVIIKDTYVGGMITPGINLSLKVLKEATAKLPLIKLKKTNKFIQAPSIITQLMNIFLKLRTSGKLL